MEFGILLNHEYKKGEDLGKRADDLVAMTHLARDSGYKLLFGMHHLLSSLATFQALPLARPLIPESGDMRLGTGVYLSNLEHPIHIAETWASLDQLSKGRVILGAGAGYRKNEFRVLGIDRKRRWSRMVEHVELLEAPLDGRGGQLPRRVTSRSRVRRAASCRHRSRYPSGSARTPKAPFAKPRGSATRGSRRRT
jgi:Coenzyme F420-dependent N5,N10-methylene tetrahydromethanopterin reductase and related flavin-dependent oxidoreductases